jgi:hypothetical protein
MLLVDLVIFSVMAIGGFIVEQCGYYPMVRRLIEMHYEDVSADTMVRWDRLTVAAQEMGGATGYYGVMGLCALYFSHVVTQDACNILALAVISVLTARSIVKAENERRRPSRFFETAR